jgi:hypothetical protein
MDEQELQTRVRDEFGVRMRPAMSKYVLEKIQAGGGVVSVIGGDARNGRAIRKELSLAMLAAVRPGDKGELS